MAGRAPGPRAIVGPSATGGSWVPSSGFDKGGTAGGEATSSATGTEGATGGTALAVVVHGWAATTTAAPRVSAPTPPRTHCCTGSRGATLLVVRGGCDPSRRVLSPRVRANDCRTRSRSAACGRNAVRPARIKASMSGFNSGIASPPFLGGALVRGCTSAAAKRDRDPILANERRFELRESGRRRRGSVRACHRPTFCWAVYRAKASSNS
jgi:hypothetical protein